MGAGGGDGAAVDFVLYASTPWDSLRQRPQQMAQQMSAWCRVAYVDWPAARPGAALIHHRDRARVVEAMRAPRKIGPNLFRVRPVELLGNRRYANTGCARRINAWALRTHVSHVCRRLGFRKQIVWGQFSERLFDRAYPAAPLLYEVVDDVRLFASAALPGEEMVRRERAIVSRAEWVVATSRALCRRVEEEYGAPCHYVPNGVTPKDFAGALNPGPPPGDLGSVPRPRVGFVGAIGHWIDVDLSVQVARLRPALSFVFVGPVVTREAGRRLEAVPNIHLLGEKPYAELPAYLGHLDVCTIPFLVNESTRSVNPVKFYEYLAADRPVVSAPLPEVAAHREVVRLARGPEAFAAAIDASLSEPREARSAARRRVAAQNTWEARCRQILDIVCTARRGGAPDRQPDSSPPATAAENLPIAL